MNEIIRFSNFSGYEKIVLKIKFLIKTKIIIHVLHFGQKVNKFILFTNHIL